MFFETDSMRSFHVDNSRKLTEDTSLIISVLIRKNYHSNNLQSAVSFLFLKPFARQLSVGVSLPFLHDATNDCDGLASIPRKLMS